MPLGGLQDEIETILRHKVQPYWKAYLWGISTAFIYTLVWMARIAEELKAKALEEYYKKHPEERPVEPEPDAPVPTELDYLKEIRDLLKGKEEAEAK